MQRFASTRETTRAPIVDNYPWPRSLTKLKWDDVKAGLETVSKEQEDGKIFRGNELGYLILNPQTLERIRREGYSHDRIGYGVRNTRKFDPCWMQFWDTVPALGVSNKVKDSVTEFLTNAPARDRPQMKLTYENMEENCDKHDSWVGGTQRSFVKIAVSWSTVMVSMVTRCWGLHLKCSCKFNKGKADALLNERNTQVRKREVLRVQQDVKIWSTKLLHKIHMDMDMSDEEAARFTSMQGTSISP